MIFFRTAPRAPRAAGWAPPHPGGRCIPARDGTRLGSEAQIDAEGVTPVVAWSDQGFFVIAYGSTDSDILARRLPL